MKTLARKRLTKKQKRTRFQVILTTLALLVGIFIGAYITTYGWSWGPLRDEFLTISQKIKEASTPTEPRVTAGEDAIHLLDVGQGSSILLQSAGGQNILIDTGRHDDQSKKVMAELDRYIGTGGTIDALIFTHSDSDHIGHGDLVLDYYDVKEVWMNGRDNTTQTYFKLLEAIERSSAAYVEPRAGEQYQFGDFVIDVLNPTPGEAENDQNEASITARVQTGHFSLIFSGDISYHVEDRIIERTKTPLKSDILIVGHHGSRYSTGRNWLRAVNPSIAFYQAGADNPYGHPHEELLHRVQDEGIEIYGTPAFGTISIYIDEQGHVDVETERTPNEET